MFARPPLACRLTARQGPTALSVAPCSVGSRAFFTRPPSLPTSCGAAQTARVLQVKPLLKRVVAQEPFIPPWVPCAASISRGLSTVARGSRGLCTVPNEPAADAARVWAMRCGHGAFVMLAGMYFMTDVVLLRVFGIIANALDMCYCAKVAATPLWLNIGWGGLYVVINAVQLYFLYSETAAVDLDPELREVYRAHFEAHGITQQQFRKLIMRAEKVTFEPGDAIQIEGRSADQLVLMTSGAAAVSENGIKVAQVDSTFVGNMSFLDGSRSASSSSPPSAEAGDSTAKSTPSTKFQATFTATSNPVAAFVWKADDLKSLLAANPSLALSVRAMLHDELLKFNKGALAYARIGSYKQLLRGVTVDGVVNREEFKFVDGFRRRAQITDADHLECLAAVGWTETQWKSGKGPRWTITGN